MNEQQALSLVTLLNEMLIEARQQTALMQQIADNQVMLIDAMADEPDDSDTPTTYMDGRPLR